MVIKTELGSFLITNQIDFNSKLLQEKKDVKY